jgi:DNA replication and repair protein RecF
MIKRINLADFRNFKRKSWEFNEKTTVIVGPNASGKTNILESLFLLSTGKSFHARIEEEMINYNAEIARVSAEIHDSKLEVALTRGENG